MKSKIKNSKKHQKPAKNKCDIDFIETLKNFEKMIKTINDLYTLEDKTFNSILLLVLSILTDCLNKNECNIENVKSYTEVLQKVMNCYSMIKNLEIKYMNAKAKEETELGKRKIRDPLQDTKECNATVSPETLQYIEENLRFI